MEPASKPSENSAGAPAQGKDIPIADSRISSTGGAQRRVLVVEDHADTCRAMRRLLCTAGYDVHTAADVATALKIAESVPLDLLISDIGLPDGSGHDLMRQLLARFAIRGIALTGYGQEEDVLKSRESGFTEHLVKPIDLLQLHKAIERVLQIAP